MPENQQDFLSAKIGLDFSKAIEELEQFEEKLEDVSNIFSDISKSAKKLSTSIIKQSFNEYLNALKDTNFNVEVEKAFSTYLKDKLAHVLVDKIKFENLNELTIPFTKELQNKLKQDIVTQIEDKVKVENLKGFKLDLNNEKTIEALRIAVSDKLNKVLSNSKNFNFSVDENELKINIETRHLQYLLNSLRNKLIGLITSNLEISINTDNDKTEVLQNLRSTIDTVYNKIIEGFQRIDTNLKDVLIKFGDTVENLNAITDISTDISNFKESLKTLIKDLNSLLNALSKLKIDKVDIDSVNRITTLISNINSQIDDYILKYLTTLQSKIVEANVSLGKSDSELVNQLEANVKSITQSIGVLINEYKQVIETYFSLRNKPNEVGSIAKFLDELENTVVGSIKRLINKLDIGSDKKSIDAKVATIESLLIESLNGIDKAIVGYVSKYSTLITTALDKRLEAIIDEIISNVDRIIEGEQGEKEEIGLRQKLENIKAKVIDVVSTSITELLAELSNFETGAITKSLNVNGKIKLFLVELEKLINDVITQSLQEITNTEFKFGIKKKVIQDTLNSIGELVENKLKQMLQELIDYISTKSVSNEKLNEAVVQEITEIVQKVNSVIKLSLSEISNDLEKGLVEISKKSEELSSFIPEFTQNVNNMFSKIIDVFKSYNVKVDINEIQSLLNQYRDLMNEAVIENLKKTFSELDNLLLEFQNVDIDVEQLKVLLLDLKTRVEEVESKIEEIFKNMKESILSDFEKLNVEGLDINLAEKVNELLNKVESTIKAYINVIQEQVSNIGNSNEFAGGARLEEISTLIKTKIQSLLDSCYEEINKFNVSFSIEELKPKVEQIEKLLGDKIIDGLNVKLPDLAESSLNKKIESEIKNKLKDLSIVIVNKINDLLQSIYNTVVFTKQQSEEISSSISQSMFLDLKMLATSVSHVMQKAFMDALTAKDIEVKLKEVLVRELKSLNPQINMSKEIDLTDVINNLLTEINKKVNSIKGVSGAESIQTTLNLVYYDLVKKLEETLKKEVSKWKPKYGNLTIDIDVVNNLAKQLLQSIQKELRKSIGEVTIDKDVNVNLSQTASKIYTEFYRKMVNDLKQFTRGIQIDKTFRVNTSQLSAQIKRLLAKDLNATIKEVKEVFPVFEGEESFKYLIELLYKDVAQQFYQLILKTFGLDIKELKNQLDNITIDTSQPLQLILNEILQQFDKLKNIVTDKIIEYVKEQFKVALKEIQQLQIVPAHILDQLQKDVEDATVETIKKNISSDTGHGEGKGVKGNVRHNVSGGMSLNEFLAKFRYGEFTSFISDYSSIPNVFIERYGHIGYIPGLYDDTRTFTKSIINTFRYIIAGRLIGEPLLNLVYEAFNSTREAEYELEKARQNILAKYRGAGLTEKPFEEYAEENIRYRYEHRVELGKLGVEEGLYLDPVKRKQLIEKMRAQMYDLVDNGIVKALQEMAISYGITQPQMATIWQISTRSQDNPLAAFAMARAAMTVAAVEREEVKPEDIARAMESIVGQWQIVPQRMTKEGITIIEKLGNEIIKASLLSQASSKDLADFLSRAGAVFNAHLPENMSLERKFATALALANIFIQATGRPGTEAATFFRNVTVAPFSKEAMNYLIKLSQSYTDEKVRRVAPFYIEYDKEGRMITRRKDFVTFFVDIINAAMALREKGQAKEADRLMSVVFKTRQFAYEQAFEKTFENMFKNFEKAGIKNFEEYVEKIQNVTQTEIDEYIGGLSKTYQFRRDQLLSSFQATSMDILKALKPDFDMLVGSLKGLLRYIRDNSDTVGKIVKTITEMLATMFILNIANKGVTKVKQGILTQEMLAYQEPLFEEEAKLVRGRYELIEQAQAKTKSLESYLAVRPELAQKISTDLLGRYIDVAVTYKTTVEQINEYIDELSSYKLNRSEIENLLKMFEDLSNLISEYNRVIDELDELRSRQKILEEKGVIDDELEALIVEKEKRLEELKNEIPKKRDVYEVTKLGLLSGVEVGKVPYVRDIMYQLENLIDEKLRVEDTYKLLSVNAFKDLSDTERNIINAPIEEIVNTRKQVNLIDKDLERLNSQIERIRKTYIALGVNEQELDNVLNRVKMQIKERIALEGKTAERAKAFNQRLKELNEQFDKGYITASQYRKALVEAETSGGGGSSGEAIGGILGVLGGILTGKGLGKIFSKIGPLLKSGAKFVGWFTALTMVFDWLSKISMSQADFKTIDVENVQRKIKEVTSARGLGKVITGIELAFNSITETITDVLSGKKGLKEAFTEDILGNWNLIYQGLIRGANSVTLSAILDVDKRQREATIELGKERRREYEKLLREWVDVNKDMIPDIPKAEYVTEESVQDFLNRRQEEEQIFIQTNDIQAQINRIQMLKSGLQSNSQEIIELMRNYYQQNKEMLEESVKMIEALQEEIKKNLGDTVALNDPMYRQLELAKLERQRQIAEYDEQIMQLYQQILSRYEQQFNLAQLKLQLTTSKELVSMYEKGVRKDSILYIETEIKGVRKQITQLEYEISQLQSLLSNPNISGDEKAQIQEQVLQKQINLQSLREEFVNLQGSKLQSVMSEYQRQLTLQNAEYTIQKANLIAMGLDENSLAYQNLEQQRLLSINDTIARTIRNLEELMKEANESQREDILIQIRDLEAQSAENLAAIYRLQKKTTEWGVPAGVKVMTQYEYEVMKNTQRSLTAQQGNVYINVKFDNVYATTKEEIQKNIIDPILRVVTSEVNRQIKRSVNVRRP